MTGHIEIFIIGGVVLLLFGATAIPKIARAIGKARREFKKALQEGEAEDETVEEKKSQNNSGPTDEGG